MVKILMMCREVLFYDPDKIAFRDFKFCLLLILARFRAWVWFARDQ